MKSALATLIVITLAWPEAAAGQIPTPESVLGHRVGDDFYLATYDESIDYFQQLAAASDRVMLQRVGTTSFGAPWYIALISSPENLANLDHHRDIARRLAHPDSLTDAEARALAHEGRAIVHIDGGLHATEVAHAQHTIQLAYDLASETSDAETLAILDNVVLLLWPSINPDGQNLVVQWYRSNLGTPFEVAPLPQLYQRYIGHDNNRDGYMINMIESRVITRVDREWEPQILYNHHQSAPFPARIWIPPFAEPISEFVHPLMWRTVNLIGMSMAEALEERGQRGAMHMGNFDNWYPGFMDHANNFHNVAALLTETGLYRYATPHFYTINDFPQNRRDLRPQSLYASPWEGGWWRLRDAVDYMLTASKSVLDVAAKYREDLLYNRYQAGRDVIAYHRENPPFAYFIPQAQRDPVAPVELLRRLAYNDVEIYQTTGPLEFEDQRYPAGTWVIPMDQPFANFVRQLFAVQDYPDLREYPEGPPDQPYDVAGWTLPYQMGVRVIEARSPLPAGLRAALAPVRGTPRSWDTEGDASPFDSPPDVGFDTHPVAAGIVPLPGRAPGSGNALAVDPAQNNSFRAVNRAWRQGAEVRMRDGEYVITGLNRAQTDRLVTDLHLQARRLQAGGTVLPRPRIGLYRPWNASIDEGWTRWLLEMYDFEFASVRNAEIRAGKLRDRFDVIVFADMSGRQILDGYARGSVPGRYAGGIGQEGIRAVDEFIRNGGTLVTLNSASEFAIEQFHLPVKDVTADLERSDFFMSGGLLQMDVDTTHPVMAGMPSPVAVVTSRSPVFDVEEGLEGQAIAKYADEGSPLMSGYLLGEEHLQGYAAALDVKHGNGHVLLLGMRPQWRGQPFGNFRILFNAALYSGAVAAGVEPNEDFWTPPEKPEEEPQERSETRRQGRRQE